MEKAVGTTDVYEVGHEGVTKYELGTVMHPLSKIAGMNMKGGKR